MTEHDSDPLARAREYTPVLQALGDEHEPAAPLEGYTVALATHMEAGHLRVPRTRQRRRR